MDRATFVRDLAEALADHEQQQQHPQQQQQQQQSSTGVVLLPLLHSTYQRVCSDDPEPISSRGAQLLRQALVDAQSPYALSAPLVRGLDRQLLLLQQQEQQQNVTRPSQSRSETDDDVPQDDAQETGPLLISASTPHDDGANELSSSSSSSSSCYASLAWTVHVQIPWLCCRTKDYTEAAAYLGSLLVMSQPQQQQQPPQPSQQDAQIQAFLDAHHPPPPPHHDNGDGDNVAVVAAADVAVPAAVINGNNNLYNNDDDNNSLTEVFADESDGSDYEFESDWNPSQQVAAMDAWQQQVEHLWDPLQLSQGPTTTTATTASSITWNDVARVVTELLQSYTVSSMLQLSLQQQWRNGLQCSNVLTELVVALLVPSSSTDSPLLTANNTNDNFSHNHWRSLGVQLLQHWQAYVLHHCCRCSETNTATTASASSSILALLQDYLRLLRILLQSGGVSCSSISMSKHISLTVKQHNATTEPAVLVSLGSLSSLCSEVLQHGSKPLSSRNHHLTTNITAALQSTVLESCDDLADLLERASVQNNSNNIGDQETVTALQWTYLALFQILTTPPHPQQPASSGMPTARAQALLNSGLWRQWLSTALATCSNRNDHTTGQMPAVSMIVVDMCLASPTLLGKYAWRVPGWTAQVAGDDEDAASSSSSSHNSGWLPALLWNLLGAHLASNNNNTAPAPTVQWKKRATPSTTTTRATNTARIWTPKECRQSAWSLFERQCQTTRQILTDWKLRREHHVVISTAVQAATLTTRQAKIELLRDWERLSTRLLTVPLLRTCFCQGMEVAASSGDDPTDITATITMIREKILPVHRILSQWPSSKVDRNEATRVDEDGDDKDRREKVESSSSKLEIQQQDECVNGLRRAIKTILSVVEEEDHVGSDCASGGRPTASLQRKSCSSKAD